MLSKGSCVSIGKAKMIVSLRTSISAKGQFRYSYSDIRRLIFCLLGETGSVSIFIAKVHT